MVVATTHSCSQATAVRLSNAGRLRETVSSRVKAEIRRSGKSRAWLSRMLALGKAVGNKQPVKDQLVLLLPCQN